MDKKDENANNIANDVLHIESQTKLSPEEIAKAQQRHNRKHKGDQNNQNMQKMKQKKAG
jgi:hypothetical protein